LWGTTKSQNGSLNFASVILSTLKAIGMGGNPNMQLERIFHKNQAYIKKRVHNSKQDLNNILKQLFYPATNEHRPITIRKQTVLENHPLKHKTFIISNFKQF